METIARAKSYFDAGYNCSQAILVAHAEEFHLPPETAIQIAAPFGGGLSRLGEVCGAVTGSLMVIGLRYASMQADDTAAKDGLYAFGQEFADLFKEQFGTILCRELVGFDISTPQGLAQARERKVFKTRCPGYVEAAAQSWKK